MKRLLLKLRAFTLVELLVVITIITLLAGLTLSTVEYANKKAAMDRARTEIAGLEVALESYKIDNGDYPRSTGTSSDMAADKLNAQVDINATYVDGGKYPQASLALYEALSADTDADRVVSPAEKAAGRVYFPFKPNMLYPPSPVGVTGVAVKGIADPFHNIYGYSTIGSGSASLAAGTQVGGYNPTFDLWTTVDPKKSGTTPLATWITNW